MKKDSFHTGTSLLPKGIDAFLAALLGFGLGRLVKSFPNRTNQTFNSSFALELFNPCTFHTTTKDNCG